MNIQSLSIVVPTKACINKCKFCVSSMHDNPYENSFDEISYRKRIKFAANNGVNTLILTGTGEALQNRDFLIKLAEVLAKEKHPFPNVELQTSGVLLKLSSKDNYYNIKLLKELGVNTISLSTSDIFSGSNNWDIIGSPKSQRIPLTELTSFIKENNFNLRLCLNMTNVYDHFSVEEILKKAKNLGADQITFRKLYHSNDGSKQSEWVKNNVCEPYTLTKISEYIAGTKTFEHGYVNGNGKPLYRLPFGAMTYSIMGMSTVIDDNCMSKNENEKLKYVILRENGKLYSQWDDEGSLIF
jgi:hypothetical protein